MQARKTHRVLSRAHGSCKSARGFQWDVRLHNLSSGGCRLDDPHRGMAIGSQVKLFIAGTGPHHAEVVWRQGERVGVEFARPLPERVFRHLAAEEWAEAQAAHKAAVHRPAIRRVI